jgi:hypothetical protein
VYPLGGHEVSPELLPELSPELLEPLPESLPKIEEESEELSAVLLIEFIKLSQPDLLAIIPVITSTVATPNEIKPISFGTLVFLSS